MEKELGYGFGKKIRTSDDCVSRQAVLDKAEIIELEDGQTFYCISPEDVKALPPVTPTFPKGVTNGDMIKAMFPLVEVKEKNNGYEVYFGVGTATQFFNHQWWNAPYKEVKNATH